MPEKYFGVTYYDLHVYKILRAGNVKGGGSKVSAKEFDEEILGWVYTRALMRYYDLLPDGRLTSALTTEDKLLPVEMVDISWKIKRFLDKHGPFAPLAIGLMTCIIDMDRMGIKSHKKYFALLDYLDDNPAEDLKDYISKITIFEKEMK